MLFCLDGVTHDKGVYEQCDSIFRVMLFCLDSVTHDGKSRNSACCCGLFSVSMVSAFLRLYQWLRRGNREKDSRALGVFMRVFVIAFVAFLRVTFPCRVDNHCLSGNARLRTKLEHEA
jgi:hypothetical protein